jgi:hypothetical protein
MELIGAAMDPYQRWKVMSEGERRERGSEREGEWNGREQRGSREWKWEREIERERGALWKGERGWLWRRGWGNVGGGSDGFLSIE